MKLSHIFHSYYKIGTQLNNRKISTEETITIINQYKLSGEE